MKADHPYDYRSYIDEKRPGHAEWRDADEQGGIQDLRRIIELVEDYKESEAAILGVFGDWGTGKTSLLEGVEYYFKKEDWPVLFFEAWKYHQEDDPVIPLLQKLVALIPDEKTKNQFGEVLRTLAVAAGDIALQAVTGGRTGIFSLERYFRFQQELGNSLLRRTVLYDTLHRQLEQAVQEILKKHKKDGKFILIVDDLDRCLPQEAVRLLEALRFHLKARNSIIILGLNETIIAQYLEDQYATRSGDKLFFGNDFLRKIFDWYIELGRMSPSQIISFFFGKLSSTKVRDVFTTLDPLSYRAWKKLSNRFDFLRKEADDEVRAAFQAVVTECFPQMNLALRQNPGFRRMLNENLALLGMKDQEVKKADSIFFRDFLVRTDESPWDKRGKEVLRRVRDIL